jgi:hypothetical protein
MVRFWESLQTADDTPFNELTSVARHAEAVTLAPTGNAATNCRRSLGQPLSTAKADTLSQQARQQLVPPGWHHHAALRRLGLTCSSPGC